jgi:phenylacetate-CoA ligase
VYEEYGAVEDVFYVSTCEHGSMHINPDAGIIEVLRPDGSPAAPGEAGEVVATGFLRQAQPMIRYRIGDTIITDDTPCKCGRGMSVVREIVGRVEDTVVGSDGRKMVRFHGLFIGLPTIIEAQVVQKSLERLEVHVVNSGALDDSVSAEIVRRVHERLTDRVRVDVLQVDRIPRGANGKYKAVVSEI